MILWLSCLVLRFAVGQDRLVDLFEYEKVTDAKCGKRGLFQRVSNLSQELPYGRTAGIDAIVAGKDLRVPPNENGQANEKIQEAAVGIGAHMGSQLIAQGVRQIVDQRRIAEMVGALPVVAVGLKGKEAIGHEDGCTAADAQDAYDLGRGLAIILNMLQYFVGQDQIEGRVGIGELLTLTEIQRRSGHVCGRHPQMVTFDVDPVDFRDGRLQRPQIDSRSAAVYQSSSQWLRSQV